MIRFASGLTIIVFVGRYGGPAVTELVLEITPDVMVGKASKGCLSGLIRVYQGVSGFDSLC
jgi:hypothetical protein